MCVGICYKTTDHLIIVNFTEPKAQLSFAANNKFEYLLWGRRQQESSSLPLGGWLSFESVKNGVWDEFFPKTVKIPALKFMEQNTEGQLRWFDITPGQFIQGIILKTGTEKRIYIVTITPKKNLLYYRWPLLITA